MDPAAALAAAQKQPESIQRQVLPDLIQTYAHVQPQAAADLAVRLPLDFPQRQETFYLVARAWWQREPLQARAWTLIHRSAFEPEDFRGLMAPEE